MKRSTKIIVAVLAFALLVGACLSLAVNASDTPTLTIAKNVDFLDKFTIAFAVEASDETAEVDLVYYLEDPALNTAATAYTPTKGSTENYENVFYTHGFSAQDIGDYVWATASIAGTDVSKTVKYSVAEYVYAMLYKHGKILATEGLELQEKAFLEAFIEFASSAQTLLVKNKLPEGETPETLVKDYYAARIIDGTLDGSNSYAFSTTPYSVTPNYTGTIPEGHILSGWTATTGNTTTTVANGTTFALTGSTVFTPNIIELDNSTLTAGYTFDNITSIPGDGSAGTTGFIFGVETIEANRGTVVEGDEIIIANDPTNANNNVLKFKDGSSSSYSTIWLQSISANGKVTNGLSVFETKLYVPKSEITSVGDDNVIAKLQFNSDGRTGLLSKNLYASNDKSYLYLSLDNTDGQETSGKITTDVWHALRLEFYNYSSLEQNPHIKVYVDNLYAGYMTIDKATDIAGGFMYKSISTALYTVYFDNMSFTEKALPTE